MDELIDRYHPGATEPAVVIALALATLWLTVGGFLILRTMARRTPFTLRLFSIHVLCLVLLVGCVRPLESVVVRSYYRLTHNPWASIVSAQRVQESRLPYVIASLVLLLLFIVTFLRTFPTRRPEWQAPNDSSS
jgi:cytochrome c oxidase assembly factor CtaG